MVARGHMNFKAAKAKKQIAMDRFELRDHEPRKPKDYDEIREKVAKFLAEREQRSQQTAE